MQRFFSNKLKELDFISLLNLTWLYYCLISRLLLVLIEHKVCYTVYGYNSLLRTKTQEPFDGIYSAITYSSPDINEAYFILSSTI